MNSSRFTLLAFVLVCALPVSSWALNPKKTQRQFVTRAWTSSHGLPANGAKDLIQTRDGYIWIGTENGLARFDGREFKIYNRFSHPDDFEFDYVTALHEGKDGTIWIGTLSGGVYSFKDEQFTGYTTQQGLASDQISALVEDASGNLYIGTRDAGFNVFDGESFATFDKTRGLVSNGVSSMAVDANGVVWVGTDQGLARFQAGLFETLTTADGLPSNRINVAYRTPEGTLWAGTDNGLARKVGHRFVSYGEDLPAQDKDVRAILQDKDGNLWFGAVNSALHMVRDGKVLLSDLSHQMRVEVNTIVEDREGNLWCGANLGGVVQYIDGKLSTLGMSQNPTADMVLSFAEANDDTMLFGVSTGLYALFEDGLKQVPGTEEIFAVSLAPSPMNDGVWVGTNGKGVYLYKDGVFSLKYTVENGLVGNRIRGILEDSKGRLWLGTPNEGLSLVAPDGVKTFGLEDGLPDLRVSQIHEQKDGTILLVTNKGLAVYDNESFVSFAEKYGIEPYIGMATYNDADGRLWWTTIGGGIFFLEGDRVFNLTRRHGLPDDQILSLNEDDLGNLWAGNNQGLFSFVKQEALEVATGNKKLLAVTEYGLKDGMLFTECNGGVQNSSYKTSKGILWFGCHGGAVQIDPSTFSSNPVPPKVGIDSLVADGETMPIDAVVPAGTVRIEIKYAGLSFVAPEVVKTKHRLAGFDTDWSEPSDARLATYTNLAPGEYVFEVLAMNNDGLWSEESEIFAFRIEPFFWQTGTFRTIVIVLAVLLIGLLSVLINLFMNKRRRAMSELSWKRTREVLEGQVDLVKELTGNVSSFSGQLHELMGQLATATDQVASSVTEAASTVSELEQTGAKAEDDAKSIVGVSAETEAASKKGLDSSQRSSDLMIQIKDDSQGIEKSGQALLAGIEEVDSVILLIQGIVNKTKILATNAAIESAKRGEEGRGFQVIAHKMKDLAIQSKDSLTIVTELLQTQKRSVEKIAVAASKGRGRTEEGVRTIADGSEIVTQLGQNVQQNSEMAHRIATTINQQIVGLNYIKTAMEEIKNATGDNKNISRDVVDGSVSLNEAIANLLDVVEQWQTPEFYSESLFK